MKIRLPAFLRDQIAHALTAKFRKDVERGSIRATCIYEKDDAGTHMYRVEFQQAKDERILLTCHGDSHDHDGSEDIPLWPVSGDIGRSVRRAEKVATSLSLAEGDELVILLRHEIQDGGRHRFRVHFKPPFSTVVYLELLGESSGVGSFLLQPTDSDTL